MLSFDHDRNVSRRCSVDVACVSHVLCTFTLFSTKRGGQEGKILLASREKQGGKSRSARSIDSSFHPSGWGKKRNRVYKMMSRFLMYLYLLYFFFFFLRRIVSFFFFLRIFLTFFFFFSFFSIFSFRARLLLTFVETRLCTSFIGWVSRITYEHFRRSHTTRTRANHGCARLHTQVHVYTRNYTHVYT